jgi:hypothetical protein
VNQIRWQLFVIGVIMTVYGSVVTGLLVGILTTLKGMQ